MASGRLLPAAAAALLAAAIASQPAAAAPITWGAATTISANTDVYTNGTALYAYAGAAATVNGVSFTAVSSTATWGSVTFGSALNTYSANGYGYAGAPFSGLSTAYSNVLASAGYNLTSAIIVNLNGLSPGHSYAVQVWANDSRNNNVTWSRNEVLASTGGNSVSLGFNATQAAGGVGQYSVGTFVADGTSQPFTLTPGATGTSSTNSQLNAISVLDTTTSSATPNWTGGGGTAWNTAGNWLAGNIPGAGNNVEFASSSTANLATVLNANFNLGTLAVLNPGGPVSISGANTLTVSNGINLAGASQNLTIAALVVLGASQSWTVTNTATLTVSSNISGGALLTAAGGGRVTLSGTNSYSGGTRISGGSTLQFAVAGSIPSSGLIAVPNTSTTGTIDLGGLILTNAGYLAFPFTSTTTLTNGTIICNTANPGYPGVSQVDYNWLGTVNLATNGNYASNQRLLIGYNYNGFGLTINGTGTNGSFTFGGDNNGNQNYVGVVTGDGAFLNINGGTVNFNNATNGTGNGYLNVGANASGASGAITVNGGNLNVGTWMKLGGNYNNLAGQTSTSSLTVTNGAVTVGGGSDAGYNGVLLMDGGNGDNTANTGVATLTLRSNATLTVAQIQAGNKGTNTINLNGGTIVANAGAAGAFLSAASNLTVNIQNGGVTVNNLNSSGVTIAAAMLANGSGGVTKMGTGQMILSGTNTYTGGTMINAGTMVAGNASAFGTGPVTINSPGGIYDLATALNFTNSLTLNGGFLRIGGSSGSVTWSGPVTLTTNGCTLGGDGGTSGTTISGSVNIGSGGSWITGNSSIGTTISGGITGSGTLNTTNSSGGNLTFKGVVSGGLGIAPGGGTLVLSGTNTFTGPAIINAGTLTVNGSGSLGSGAYGANLTNNAAFSYGSSVAQILSGVVSGTGVLTDSGSGMLTLSGVNTYTGATTVSAGTLAIGGSGSLGSGNYAANITDNAAFVFNSSAVQTLSGIVSGTGSLTASGSGTLNLTGANTYTGETVFTNGIINVASLSTYAGEAAGGSPLGGRTSAQDTTSTIGLHFSGGTLQYTNTGLGAQTTDRYIRIKGGTSTSAIDASGATSADTITFSQSGAPINFWDGTGTRSLTLTGSNPGNNTFAQNIPDYNNGSSATSLIKNGAGTWDVINTNNGAAGTTANNAYGGYTGGTTISGGTLGFATNALGASGTVQFTGNATLRWDSGNAQDLSSRLKINDGVTATFDPGANNVTLASALSVGTAKTGALTKSSSGTLILSGANTYTGATTISAGTLTIGGAGSLGGGSYAAAITDNGTLSFNSSAVQILSGNISGTGGLTYLGAGGLTLTATNTYASGTTVTGGAVVPGNGFAFGTNTLTINAGGNVYPVASMTVSNALVLNGGKLELGGGGSHQMNWNGSVTVTATNSSITADGGTGYNVSGAGGGDWGAAITVNGTVNIGGSTNTLLCYGGNYGITLNGTVSGANGTVEDTAQELWLTAATNTFAGTIRSTASSATVILGYSGANSVNYMTIDMNTNDSGSFLFKNYPCTIGGLMGGRNLAISGALSVGINNTSTSYNGALTGGGALTVVGTGTLTLSGTNSYTGNTTVSAGTLALGTNGVLPATTIVNLNWGTLAMGMFNSTVSGIQSNGIAKAQGTWGAPGSGANHISSSLAGTGILTVTGGGSSTSVVSSSENPATYGDSVTLTNTVTGIGGDGSAPSGEVTFFDGTNSIGTGTFAGSAGTVSVYTLTVSLFTAATHSITASYAGNVIYDVSTSSPVSEVVNQAVSTATVTVNNSPVSYNGAGQAAAVTLSGTNTAGSVTAILTGGAATQTDAGAYAVTATFVPDDTNYTTLSGLSAGSFAINQVASTTTTVGAGPFNYDGTTHTGGSGTVAGAGGLSTSASSLTYSGDQINVGTYYVTAHYAGDTNHTASDGAAVAITIGQATTVLFSGLNSLTNGYGVTNLILTGTVSAAGAAYPTNGETVSATINGFTVSGTVTNGTGAFAIDYNDPSLATNGVAGSPYTITYNYGGDANLAAATADASTTLTITNALLGVTANNDSKSYDGNAYATNTGVTYAGFVNGETAAVLGGALTYGGTSQGAINAGTYPIVPAGLTSPNYAFNYTNGTLTVNPAGAGLTIGSSVNPVGYLGGVTFSATLATNATGSAVFSAPGGAFSTNTLSSGLAGSLTITNLARGTNVITVVYGGDSNYLAATNSFNQVVTNHAPVAGIMTVTITAGLGGEIALSDLATNWTDGDADTVELKAVNLTTTNGVSLYPINLTTNLDGSYVITNIAYLGYTNPLNVGDRISYSIGDGFGGTNVGYINIVVVSSVPGTNSITGITGGNPNGLTAYGVPGFSYITERSTNLTDWAAISTNTAATNGLINVSDPFADLGSNAPPAAFYRLLWQP